MSQNTNPISRRTALSGLLTGVASLAVATTATAYPYRRGYRGAPYRPGGYAVNRGVARRTSRRVTRRHLYGLPGGYRPYRWGAYNYYRVGSLFYYPYMYQGRTVYIEINVDSGGNPLPPPPASQALVEIDIDID